MIVVASNDSFRLTRLFDLFICAGNSRSYGFLTKAEVAEVEDGVVIIGCVAIFYEDGEGGEHYRNYINVVYFSVIICELCINA